MPLTTIIFREPMPSQPRRLSADLGLLALTVIWGINFSVVKVALVEVGPLAFNALRFPLACLVLWGLVRGTPGPMLPRRGDLPRVLLLGLVGNVIYQLCFIFGLNWTLAGNASLLLATTPVWTLVLSALAGHERPSRGAVVGTLGTLGGMLLIVTGHGDGLSFRGSTVAGDLLMISGAILWSAYTVGGRGPVARYGALRMTAWTLWASTPVLVLLAVPELLGTDFSGIGFATWMGVVYAGVLSLGLAYLLWYRGVETLGNNRTAIYSNLVPVAALVTAWLWLGEVPAGLQLVGAAVVFAGLTVARLTQSADPEPIPPRWSSSGNS